MKKKRESSYYLRLWLSTIMARSDYHLIWNSMFLYEVEFSSVIRSHHVHKAACSPIIGESLACRNDDRKEAKEHDEYAVGTYLEADNKLIGHVPMELSFLIFTFLKARHENKVKVKVTGSRTLENGLVVPGAFLARTTGRAIATKFEEEITRLKENRIITFHLL